MYKNLLKRLLDVLLSLIGLLLLFPLFIFVTLLLTLTNNGKPYFFQSRPGKNERIFRIIKFKTMNDKRDNSGKLLPDSQRLTKIGKLIRKTSIDELPQLINVFRGDMSLIGPRPLSTKYLDLYNPVQKRRHEVRPGITGWAQVNGRNSLTWSKRFEYDIWYVDNVRFLVDFRIFLYTLKKVLKREGVLEGGTADLESFNGNN